MEKVGPLLIALATVAAGTDLVVLDDAQGLATDTSASHCESAGHQSGSRHNNGKFDADFMTGDSKTFFEWNFEVQKDGCYLVEEHHPDVANCIASKPGPVPVRIDYCRGATARIVIDQSQYADEWREVAMLPFYVDRPARIALQREGGHAENVCPDGNCLWIADAFRLTYLAGNCREAAKLRRAKPAQEMVTTPVPTSGKEDSSTFSLSTTSTQPVAAGATTIALANVDGIQAGHMLEISDGTFTESHEVDGVTTPRRLAGRRLAAGIVTLKTPLTNAYAVGVTIAVSEVHIDEVQEESQLLDKELEELEIPEFDAPPPAALQMTLSEPRMDGADAKFVFDPPQDGCYMVEEMHPHSAAAETAPLTVNYCKGLKAEGIVNLADGKHEQWNYVASLPFYDQDEGSIVMSRRLLEMQPGAHQFRLTHLGSRCSHAQSHVFSATLRIKTDFSLVKDKIREFKAQLSELLSPYARVHPSRLRTADVYEGSIVADLTLLPPNSAIGWNAPPHSVVDAQEAATNLQNALTASDSPAAEHICSLVGAEDGCVVTMEAFGRKAPLIRTVPSQPETSWSKESCMFLIVLGSVCGVLALGSVMMCICFSKKKVDLESNEASAKEIAPGVVVEVVEAEKELADKEIEKGKDDDASTATPKDFEADDENFEIMTTTLTDGQSDGSGSKTLEAQAPREQPSQAPAHASEDV